MDCSRVSPRSYGFKSRSVLALFFVSSVLGCTTTQGRCVTGNTVTIPGSDASAPTAAMDAHFPSQPMITVTASSGDIGGKVGGNDKITLIAVGSDPEGVKDIQIYLEETWWVTDPATGVTSQKGPGLVGGPEKSNPDNDGTGGSGCSSRATALNLDIQQKRAAATGYRARAWANAVNFGGKETKTSIINLTWP